MVNDNSQRTAAPVLRALYAQLEHDNAPQQIMATVIREMYIAVGRDDDAIVYGLAEALGEHDPNGLGRAIEDALNGVLAARRDGGQRGPVLVASED